MSFLIISAGHGGSDTGARAFGYREKDLTLALAHRVSELLIERNPDMVREEDITVSPTERANRIRSKYKYCLDLHFNAANGQARGIETIHSAFSKNGERLAHEIADALRDYTSIPVRRVFSRKNSTGRDFYYMHRLTGSTTTIIVEGLFLDNLQDIEMLNLERIARGIATGFEKGIRIIERPKLDLGIEVTPPKYYRISLTDIAEVHPYALDISVQDKPANQIQLENFVTAGYQMMQANGEAYPLGILVSDGKVIQNRQPHNLPAGTFLVYNDGTVDVKPVLDITKEEKPVRFAVSGCTILPDIRMKQEGFVGPYSDIGRPTWRPVMGWNPEKQKVIIAVRPESNIARGQLTLLNLGCTKGITLDAGGSTVFRCDGEWKKSTTRQLHSVVTW